MEELLKSLSHPAWQGVGALVTIVSIVVMVMQWKDQRERAETNDSSASYTPFNRRTYNKLESSAFTPISLPLLIMLVSFSITMLLFINNPVGGNGSSAWKPGIVGTAIPVTYSPTPVIQEITVFNQLLLPVQVFTDNTYRGIVEPSSSVSFSITGDTTSVFIEVTRAANSAGEPLGEQISEQVDYAHSGDTIVIDNLIGAQYYFYPIITNSSSSDCTVVINDGLQSEIKPSALLSAHSKNIGLGYYRLYNESNVSLYCDDRISWVGVRGDGNGTPLFSHVSPLNGEFRAHFELK